MTPHRSVCAAHRWNQYVNIRSWSFASRSRTLGVANLAGFPFEEGERRAGWILRALCDVHEYLRSLLVNGR
jgi:hypothetical protein